MRRPYPPINQCSAADGCWRSPGSEKRLPTIYVRSSTTIHMKTVPGVAAKPLLRAKGLQGIDAHRARGWYRCGRERHEREHAGREAHRQWIAASNTK